GGRLKRADFRELNHSITPSRRFITMFTHRICCCSATVASMTMAVIGIILTGWLALSGWLISNQLADNITLTVFVVLEVIACIMVFIACCTHKAIFMIPIIVIQFLNTCSLIGSAIYIFIWYSMDMWTIIYLGCSYAISISISLFISHCHVCCYKLLRFQAHMCHHHGYHA
ncbi:hypothetical protein PFISCL1PPCAC_13099, partial [Pristionchus fissidentatus]